MGLKDQYFSRIKEAVSGLAKIPAGQWLTLASELQLETAPKGKLLVRQGEPADRIFLVCKGLLKTFFIEPSGDEITKGFVWEGKFGAPYVSILTKQPSNFSIVTLEDSVLLSIRASTLERLYEAHPCWQEVGRKIAEGLLIERERREYQMMAFDAAGRYEAFLQLFPDIVDRVPLYEIASYLGITPVALSKIRARKTKKKQ